MTKYNKLAFIDSFLQVFEESVLECNYSREILTNFAMTNMIMADKPKKYNVIDLRY